MSQMLEHWYIPVLVAIARFKHKKIYIASMNFKKPDNKRLKCDLMIIHYDYDCK